VSVPVTLEDATSPTWLSVALGTEVTAVAVGELDERVSTNAPMHIEDADGHSRDVWLKGYYTPRGRDYRMAGVPEAMFYRELQPTLGVRTLRPLHAAVDTSTQDNVLVTEHADGAVFLDATSRYSVDQAAASLEQLALLHSSTWMARSWRGASWLDSRLLLYHLVRTAAEIDDNLRGPTGDAVPGPARDAQRLYDAFGIVAAQIETATPWSVIHGDPHIRNLYLDDADRPCFADWQLVQRGPWYLDVGYHLAAVLSVEDRRRVEDDLVRGYLARLAAGGIDVAFDAEARGGLCRGFVQGFYLWGITQHVDPAQTAVLLERLGTAVVDHDAYSEVLP
jgi:Phosphotransferase enzyme family